MNVFDVLRKKLEEQKEVYKKNRKNTYCRRTETDDCGACIADKRLANRLDTIEDINKIINQVEQEYNNGWIPCSEYVPEDGDWVLCYGKNREGRIKYEVSTYAHEIQCWMCSRIADVIAWQPLPPKYEPKGE